MDASDSSTMQPEAAPEQAVVPSLDEAAATPGEARVREMIQKGEAEGALELLKQSAPLNVRTINMAFTAKVAAGHDVHSAAVQMMSTCQQSGLTPTAAMHNNVLAALSRSRTTPPEALLSWLARMRASSIGLDRVACNIELKAHVAMDNHAAAVELLTSMMRGAPDGPPTPDAISFNTVISALAQAGQVSKAETLLTTMLDARYEPDIRSYTGVIMACARASRPVQAAHWLERMLQSDVPPDTTAFNAVLLAYATACDCEGAFLCMSSYEARARDECPNAKPDVVSFNTLISACAKEAKPERAEMAFSQMRKRGLVPNEITYSTLITARARGGQPAKAQAWLDAMIESGVAPDVVSYNAVCAAHAKVGDTAAALECLRQMELQGLKASPNTHASMVNALVQSGRAEEAEVGLRKIIASGERLGAGSFNALLNLHAKEGRAEAAYKIIELMKQSGVAPTLVTYNSLAASHASNGDLAATERILGQATKSGFALDRYSYGALLQACIKGGRAARAGPQRQARAARDAPRADGGEMRLAARRHVEVMLDSGIPINDYLASTAASAIGDAAFREMRISRSQLQTRASSSGAPAPASDASAAGAKGDDAMDDDGWTTVRSASKGSGGRRPARYSNEHRSSGGRSGLSGRVAPKSPIGKERPPPPKQPTAAGSRDAADGNATAEVRMVGVQMTRSRSERARLLSIAQDAITAEKAANNAERATASLPPGLSVARSAGSLAAVTDDEALRSLPPSVPLTRSAASELAITLGHDMVL